LEKVLDKHKLDEGEVERIKNIRKEIQNGFDSQYGSKIEKVIYSGSYAKKTAIALKYDIDLCIYFKKDAFSTLSGMYEDVYNFLEKNYGKYNPKKQNVSLRLDLKDGRSIDVVPARSFEDGTDDANLYSSRNKSSIKTNIRKHVDYIGESEARPVIKLMKIWKYRHGIHFKSFALELLIIKALENCNSKDYSDQVLHVLRFIKDNIMTVKLIDPANSNNIVSDQIDITDKQNMQNQALSSLNKAYWSNIIW
jgi:predicted nucleotidyltransferase